MEEPQFKELSQMLATESLTPEQRQELARQLLPAAPRSNSSGDAAPVAPPPDAHHLCQDAACPTCGPARDHYARQGAGFARQRLLNVPGVIEAVTTFEVGQTPITILP